MVISEVSTNDVDIRLPNLVTDLLDQSDRDELESLKDFGIYKHNNVPKDPKIIE